MIKLDKHTIDVLKNFSNINSMLHINPGREIATSQSTGTRSVFYARATVDVEFPRAITVYDVNELLRAIRAFDNDDVFVEPLDHEMIIRDESNRKRIRFAYGNPKLIRKEILEGKKIDLEDFFDTFTLNDQDFSFIISQARTLALTDIAFVCNADGLYMSAGDTNAKKVDVVSVKMRDPLNDSKWRFEFSLENIVRFLSGSYEASIKVMPNRNVIGQFVHKTVNLKYILGANNANCSVG